MIWGACCTAFFGFFHVGEITIPSANSFDTHRHLAFQDIATDSVQSPRLIRIRLKHFKTDQFGWGADIFLGNTGNELCPVTAILAYLAVRGGEAGPLFHRANGTPLTRSWFVDEVKRALASLGYTQSLYSGHSFRIGAATTTAAVHIEDSMIQALGRWTSTAFLTYIRTPRDQLAQLSSKLSGRQAEVSSTMG